MTKQVSICYGSPSRTICAFLWKIGARRTLLHLERRGGCASRLTRLVPGEKEKQEGAGQSVETCTA